MDNQLIVCLYDKPIGVLEKTRKGARFRYEPEIASSRAGEALLSVSLPVKSKSYSEGLTGAWFSGLLPEGPRLERLCQQIGCSQSDYFAILSEIGWECAGAVSLRSPGQSTVTDRDGASLSQSVLANALSDIGRYELAHPQVRLSLGGFQDKLSVFANELEVGSGYVKAFRFSTPSPSLTSTHILKPQPSDSYPNLVELEAWCMRAASRTTATADTSVLELPDCPLTLVVKRFDRMVGESGVARLHHEDGCQALGLDPGNKYASTKQQKGSDPTLKKLASILAARSDDFEAALKALLEQVTVNVLLGNLDAHAKNYSLVHREGYVSLSPMYDVVPTQLYGEGVLPLSMRINDKIDLDELTARDLKTEAVKWGLPSSFAADVIATVSENLLTAAEEASSFYPKVAETCERLLCDNARQLGLAYGKAATASTPDVFRHSRSISSNKELPSLKEERERLASQARKPSAPSRMHGRML